MERQLFISLMKYLINEKSFRILAANSCIAATKLTLMRQTNQNACITAVLEKIAEQLPNRLKSPGNICNMALGRTFLPQHAGSKQYLEPSPIKGLHSTAYKENYIHALCITPTAILSLVSLYLPRSKNTKRISTLRPVR